MPENEPRKTRLPLQLGTTFVREVIVATTLIASLPLLPLLMIVLFGKSDAAERLGVGAWVLTLMCPAVALLVGYASLKRARKRRPSDILIDPRGLVVQGGSQHGLEIEWSSVEPEQWKVTAEGRVRRLVLSSGSDLELAETTSRSEQRLFDLTARTLREVTRFARGAAASPSRRPDLLLCPACGNAVAPDDTDHVRCDYCSATVAVPADVRHRVRRAAEVQRANSAAARRIVTLFDQPTAPSTSRTIVLLAIPLLGAWIFSAWVTYRLDHANALRGDSALGLIGFVAISGVGCYLAGRAHADRRGTFALVAHQLSALAPPRPGAHHGCRACGAPLWEPPHEVVLICAHCETENVLGFDVRHDRAESADRFQIADALARMSRQRALSVMLIVAGAVAALLAVRVGMAALHSSLEAAGYVDEPSQLPEPTGPWYEPDVTVDWAPPPGSPVEEISLPRVRMRSTLSEAIPLYERVWECHARELAAGGRAGGTLRVVRWRKVGDGDPNHFRTDIRIDGELAPSLSQCVRERVWQSREPGVALFILSDRRLKRLRPPPASIAKSAFAERIDATLLAIESTTVVAADEPGRKAMWRRYTVRADARFLIAGFENRCAISTTFTREADRGCVSIAHAAGDSVVITKPFFVMLSAQGWCGNDDLGGRCYCGGDAVCPNEQ